MDKLASRALVCRVRLPLRVLLSSRRIPLPSVGPAFPSAPLLRLPDGGEAVLTAEREGRRLELRARRRGEEFYLEARDVCEKWAFRVGRHHVEVVPLLLDTGKVRVRRMDEGRWRVEVPRWFEGAAPRVEVEQGEGRAAVYCDVPLREGRSLSGGVLLLERGGGLSVLPLKGKCLRCGLPMVGKGTEVPEGVEAGVFLERGLCLACGLSEGGNNG